MTFLNLLVSVALGALGSRAAATLIHVPNDLEPARANVLVALHGCAQSPEAMALGTSLNRDAGAHNTVIIYPAAPADAPGGCWSWYLPEHQRAGAGQLASVMNEVSRVERALGLRNPPTFVVGFSAGASLAAGLLACYPDRFRGGVLHSGTPYASAANAVEAALVMTGGPRGFRFEEPRKTSCDPAAFAGRLLIIQGLEDRTVRSANATALVGQFLPGAKASARATARDHSSRYDYRDYADSAGVGAGILPRARIIKVFSLGHAWSGTAVWSFAGPNSGLLIMPYFSPYGPSATEHTWNFISETLGRKTEL